MVENVIGGLLLTGFGGFVAWAALNSTREDVNPRSTPGLRTPTTMSSREAWLAAHRVISGPLWWMGVALTTIGCGVIVWSFAGSPSEAEVERVVLGVTIGTVIAALVMVLVGDRAARRVSHEVGGRQCPFCAEEIKPGAIVCKHCGRDLPGQGGSGKAGE